jgi:hypothetical protein
LVQLVGCFLLHDQSIILYSMLKSVVFRCFLFIYLSRGHHCPSLCPELAASACVLHYLYCLELLAWILFVQSLSWFFYFIFRTTAPLGPMRFTDAVYKNKDDYELCEGINIFSVKIATSDVGFPINVYGTVIARDSLDKRCVYIFRRERDQCQLINSEVCTLGTQATLLL